MTPHCATSLLQLSEPLSSTDRFSSSFHMPDRSLPDCKYSGSVGMETDSGTEIEGGMLTSCSGWAEGCTMRSAGSHSPSS